MNKQKKKNLFLITLATVFVIIISTLIIFTLKKPTFPDNNRKSNNGCIKGGCSGQLCVDEQEGESGISTCEWRDEYECYKHAVCERQKDGKCAFTPNAQFQQCFDKNLPALKKPIN